MNTKTDEAKAQLFTKRMQHNVRGFLQPDATYLFQMGRVSFFRRDAGIYALWDTDSGLVRLKTPFTGADNTAPDFRDWMEDSNTLAEVSAKEGMVKS